MSAGQKSLLGWLDDIAHYPSPNFNSRPNAEISLIVIHCISLPPNQFGTKKVHDFFCNKLKIDEDPYFQQIANLQVSAHFLIERDGLITQFVSCDDRAWHAGQSNFNGRDNCNDFAIGIELEGTIYQEFTSIQYQQLAHLIRQLIIRYPSLISNNQLNICGHSDIAPNRKQDPGEFFYWDKLSYLLHNKSV